jgi:hypothetical protein
VYIEPKFWVVFFMAGYLRWSINHLSREQPVFKIQAPRVGRAFFVKKLGQGRDLHFPILVKFIVNHVGNLVVKHAIRPCHKGYILLRCNAVLTFFKFLIAGVFKNAVLGGIPVSGQRPVSLHVGICIP